MPEMRDIIIKYITKYQKLIETGGMTLGGIHKVMKEDGITCSRNYVYLTYNTLYASKKDTKPASKGKAGKGRKGK